MNFLKYFLLTLVIFPLNVFAGSFALNDMFYIDSQTSEPYNFNINANSSVNHVFHIEYSYIHGQNDIWNIPGNYFFVSIVSNQKLSIKRQYNYGANCSSSCFANDVYLQDNGYNNGSYDYIMYFNARKWNENLGTQTDVYSIADSFTFINKGTSQATVYFYGAYANDINQIPGLINDANTTNSIIIQGQDNTQEIIDNQNNNTQEIIDNLKDCRNSVNLVTIQPGDNVGVNNNVVFTELLTAGTYTLSFKNSGAGGFNIRLDSLNSSNFLTFYPYPATTYYTNTFTLNESHYLVFNGWGGFNISQFQVQKGSIATDYEDYGVQICTNKIDETTNAINETNNSINNVNNSINNSGIDNPNNDFADMEDLIAHNGVITNLIALPITLYTSILNNVNSSCSSFNLGSLFNKNITFTCINLGNILGSTIWGVIDVLFSGFTIYSISKKMIKVFQNFSGLQEGDVLDD